MCGYVFLLINGYELTAPSDDMVDIASGLATKDYSCEDLENWLCHWSRTYDTVELCNPDFGKLCCGVIKLKNI